MECSTCKIALPADARFCASCGTPAARSTEAEVDPLRELLKVALGRQYEILRLLGRGGMGAVYLARESSLDREVAIKVLPTHQHATEESRERFRREARTAAKLSHPNIVPLHTFGEVDGTLYFVMGYVRGESLAAKLRREGRLEVDTSRRILSDVAQALEYAHGLGIVHRDIKPDNVLIEEATGRAILTDFGVAKPLGAGETLTVQGSLLGTPHYMSPEQASGRSDVDHRSDLYSLGVMGYAMLAGRLPFEGATTGELLVQHITAAPPALKTLAPDVPVELSSALTRCLAKEPGKRWYNAADFRASLEPPGEDDLPPAFADLRETVRSLLIFSLLAIYGATWFAGGGGDGERAIVVLVFASLAIVTPLLMGAVKWRSLRKAGYEPRRIARETFLQPKKWIGWYPRRLRASRDVWDRLPVDLRRARASLGAFLGSAFLFVIPFWIGLMAKVNKPEFDKSQFPKWMIAFMAAAGALPLVSGAFFQLCWRRRARAAGVYDPAIESQIVTKATSESSFWSKPAVARLLAPTETTSKRSISAPETTGEMMAAISSIVSALDFPARELGERARLAARQVASSLEGLDREITALALTADPLQGDRLRVRLDALRSDPAGASGDVETMLQQQLDLVHKLESRFEQVKNDRARRAELLRTLWLQVNALRAADGTARNDETLERVGAICDDIGAHVAASETAVRAAQQATIVR